MSVAATAQEDDTATAADWSEMDQWLERKHPEAFVSGEALERVLAEVEHGKYMSKAKSGEWRAVTKRGSPMEIAFPSAMALALWSCPGNA